MANDYFQFKQFRISQSQAAMKVSTDACIQGALFVQFLKSKNPFYPNQILDIGTGTGLLSLMLAQAFPQSQITAIENNENALKDASLNFESSIWKQQFQLLEIDYNQFDPSQKFDAVICNPPFFNNQLLTSNSSARLYARHDIQLTKETLIQKTEKLLTSGYFCVMYPHSEWLQWQSLMSDSNLHLEHQINIQPNNTKPCNRVIGIYSTEPILQPLIEEWIIYKAPQQYSDSFCEVMKDYYLYL